MKTLNIALPKGRLGEKAYALLEKAGYACPSVLDDGRKLIFESEDGTVRYFWVKPSDVTVYVERGVADLGIAGKDILLENVPDVYEMADLKLGRCRMCVAAKDGFEYPADRTLVVATKFPNISTRFFGNQSRPIEIVKLNGSIELAPILGLSDVIVDIVETGTTLKENHLSVVETVEQISARLIANRSSYRFKYEEIITAAQRLRAQIGKDDK